MKLHLLLRQLLLVAIRVYQRYLSPHKGFSCAYRVHTGRASCSDLGYRAVRRFGVRGGLVLIRARTRRCGAVHRHHHPMAQPGPYRVPVAQRGDCDISCDLPCAANSSCDMPPLADVCDVLSACDGCGDCGGSSKRRESKTQTASAYRLR